MNRTKTIRPPEISTIDARGSDAGTVTVPNDGVTVAMFFVTGCGNCQAQMSHLAEARETPERDGDRVTVLDHLPDSRNHAGSRPSGVVGRPGRKLVRGYDLPSLAASYGVVGYPATIVVDEAGEKRWHEVGVQPSSDIVQATDSVLEEPTGSDRLANDNDDGG